MSDEEDGATTKAFSPIWHKCQIGVRSARKCLYRFKTYRMVFDLRVHEISYAAG